MTMEFSKLPEVELKQLKVGDVVAIDRSWTGQGRVVAPIIAVEQRWGTSALPLLTLEGHDPNWEGKGDEPIRHDLSLQFGAHCVLEIVTRGAYVVPKLHTPRNIHAEYVTGRLNNVDFEYWNYPRRDAPKGQLCGRYREMRELFVFALAKLPYEIVTWLNEERATMLWKQAGCPGLVRSPDPIPEEGDRRSRRLSVLEPLQSNEHYFVREKPFCRFVRQNWSKLVMTRAEMDKQADDHLKWEQESMLCDMEDECDFQEDHEPDFEGSYEYGPADWVEADAY